MLNVIQLNTIVLNADILIVILQNFTVLNDILLRIILLNADILNVILQNSLC